MDVTASSLVMLGPVILFIVGMYVHTHILIKYSRYSASSFKSEHQMTYAHLFKDKMPYDNRNLNSNSNIPNHVPNIGVDISIEPRWAYELNKTNNLSLVIFVLSAPENSFKRSEMRSDFQMYLKSNNEDNPKANNELLTLTFLIGKAKNEKLNLEIKEESRIYRDILWMEMEDSYTNCAYKVLGSYEWIINVINSIKTSQKVDSDTTIQNNTNGEGKIKVSPQRQVRMKIASSIEYIVKVDDDMEINYPNLVHELKTESFESNPNHMSILCSAVLNNHVAEWRNDSMTRKW